MFWVWLLWFCITTRISFPVLKHRPQHQLIITRTCHCYLLCYLLVVLNRSCVHFNQMYCLKNLLLIVTYCLLPIAVFLSSGEALYSYSVRILYTVLHVTAINCFRHKVTWLIIFRSICLLDRKWTTFQKSLTQ